MPVLELVSRQRVSFAIESPPPCITCQSPRLPKVQVLVPSIAVPAQKPLAVGPLLWSWQLESVDVRLAGTASSDAMAIVPAVVDRLHAGTESYEQELLLSMDVLFCGSPACACRQLSPSSHFPAKWCRQRLVFANSSVHRNSAVRCAYLHSGSVQLSFRGQSAVLFRSGSCRSSSSWCAKTHKAPRLQRPCL